MFKKLLVLNYFGPLASLCRAAIGPKGPGPALEPKKSLVRRIFYGRCSFHLPRRRRAPPPASPSLLRITAASRTTAARAPTEPPKMPAMLAAQFTALPLSQSPSPQPSFRLALRPSPAARARSLAPRAAASAAAVFSKPAADSSPLVVDRSVVRIGLPSKGRMAEQTLSLLKVRRSFPMGVSVAWLERLDCMIGVLIWLWLCSLCLMMQSCQLSVRQLNPRQYTADIPLVRFTVLCPLISDLITFC